ncbi:SAM-dependent methyltransferase [Corynebacterium otitidis]|uniref:SAM-dependent methyltransferase n=2 Tax=Corynebacterium otitidis TaxID=29321 RepID=UPI0002F75840|nr:class I SAM-dependent methyltransferase [Corynebacterium otitidis]
MGEDVSGDHLSHIDAASWPGVAAVPAPPLIRLKARAAEAGFARACQAAGVELDPDEGADLTVDHEELFARLAAGGWVGLLESYLAGEWRAEDLAGVLEALLRAGYQPSRRRLKAGEATGGALPPRLVALCSTDGASHFFGRFASSVGTSVRETLPAAGREEPRRFVERTRYSRPVDVARADLREAQRRAAESLLDLARVRPGSHLLELPASGGVLAGLAARRQATVDVLSADEASLEALRERLVLDGVGDQVHAEHVDAAVPRGVPGRFDAVVSIEYLETLSPKQRRRFFRFLDHVVGPRGEVALQSVVRGAALGPAGEAALDGLRAYIWPGLSYPSDGEVYRLVDQDTGLRLVEEHRLDVHAEETLRLQAELFRARRREAAAAGFDVVFRRLWDFQYALRLALVRIGALEARQWRLVRRRPR